MGRYCSYLVPKQTGRTTQILIFKTLRMIHRPPRSVKQLSSPERCHPDRPEVWVDADGEEGPDAAVLGDQAAEVVALEGQPDDAVHRVPQRRQDIAGRRRGLPRLAAAAAGTVLPEGIHAQL